MPLNIDFSISPIDPTAYSYTVGGNTYPYIHQADAITRTSDSRYNVTINKTNTTLTFTASVVAPPGSTSLVPVEYKWKMGDGTILYGPVITYTYIAAVPQLTASLIVTDQNLVQYTRQKLLNLRAGTRILMGQPFRVTG